MTHNIRLHGPWQCEFPEADAPSQRIRIPGDLRDAIQHPSRGAVQLQRKFNRPTGLDAAQAVMLVFEEVHGAESVQFNGETLTLRSHGESGVATEVTTLLKPTNVICVSLLRQSSGELPRGITGEVRLEIAEEEPAG